MKRAAGVGIAVGAALAIGALAVAMGVVASRPPSGQDAARGYLTALAEGDIARINSMRSPLPDDAAELIITDAFERAESFISDPRIAEISTNSDGTMSVTATVQLVGAQRDIHFMMRLEEGAWKLTGDYLGMLRVRTAHDEVPLGDSVAIGGVLASTGSDVALLPAEYHVAAAPAGVLAGESTIALSNDRPTDLTIQTSVTAEATTRAQTQLNAYVDACTAASATVPLNCGIRVPWAADLHSLDRVTFRIEKYPRADIAADATTFAATDGILIATVTGVARGGGPDSFTYRADDWALRGSVTFTGDQMLLAVG